MRFASDLRLLLAAAFVTALLLIPATALAQAALTIGETLTIDSKVLVETRRINVYAPAAYVASADLRLPVLYMPDGGMAEDFLHVAGLVQVLVGNGTMRPFLLVGIENTQRRRDLSGPTENAEDRKMALARDLADLLARHAPANLAWHYELLANETHATLYHPAALQALRHLFKPQ